MAQPTITVSTDNKNWQRSCSIVEGDIYFKITTNGERTLRLVIPVDYPGNPNTKENNSLLTANQWATAFYTAIKGVTQDVDIKKEEKSHSIPIVIHSDPVPDEIVIKFQNYTPAIPDLKATCWLQYKEGEKWGPAVKDDPDTHRDQTVIVQATANADAPVIRKFTALPPILGTSGSTTLLWDTDADTDADSVTITDNTKYPPVSISPPRLPGSQSVTSPSTMCTWRFSLKAKKGGNSVTQSLELSVYDNNHFGSPNTGHGSTFLDSGSLMNIFTLDPNDKMYGLVQTMNGDNVEIWESYDGAKWAKSVAYSKALPSFKDANIPIPVAFAGSPCVVYNKKVFLTGGSRFDPSPEVMSNAVYYFDFNQPESGWQQQQCDTFPKRVAAAVCNRKTYLSDGKVSEKIYLLGGCDEQGALDDVWTYTDDEGWKHASGDSMPGARCMHSAVTIPPAKPQQGKSDVILVYGGYSDKPGKPDVDILSYFQFQDGWIQKQYASSIKFPSNNCQGNSAQVASDSLFWTIDTGDADVSYKGKLHLILSPLVGATDAKFAILDPVANNLNGKESVNLSGNAFDNDAIYSIQTLLFKQVPWFLFVTRNFMLQSNLYFFVN